MDANRQRRRLAVRLPYFTTVQQTGQVGEQTTRKKTSNEPFSAPGLPNWFGEPSENKGFRRINQINNNILHATKMLAT